MRISLKIFNNIGWQWTDWSWDNSITGNEILNFAFEDQQDVPADWNGEYILKYLISDINDIVLRYLKIIKIDQYKVFTFESPK